MEISILHRKTCGTTLFWSLMVLCIMLTVACIFLAAPQVGQPWGGFAFNVWAR
jgi:hypothetical protein